MRNVLRKPDELLKGVTRFTEAVQLLVEIRHAMQRGRFACAVAHLALYRQSLLIQAQGLLRAVYRIVRFRHAIQRGRFTRAVAHLAPYGQGLLKEAKGVLRTAYCL